MDPVGLDVNWMYQYKLLLLPLLLSLTQIGIEIDINVYVCMYIHTCMYVCAYICVCVCVSFLVLSPKSIQKKDYQAVMIMPNIQILVSKYTILQEK